MKIFFQGLKVQYKLFIQDKVNWLFALLMLIVVFTYQSPVSLADRHPLVSSANASSYLGMLSPLIFVIVYVRFFFIELTNKHTYLWSHNKFGNNFLLSKILAGLLGFFSFLLPTLIIYLGCIGINIGFEQVMPSLRIWLFFLLPSYIFVIIFCTLVSTIIRQSLASMIAILLAFSTVSFRMSSTMDLLTFAPDPGFTSEIIMFGPQRLPLLFNRAYILALSMVLLLLALLIARIRLPWNPSKLKPLAVGGFSILSIALLMATVWLGQQVNRQRELILAEPNSNSRQAQLQICESLNSYKVELEISGNGTEITGLAQIKSSSPLKIQEFLSLNAGMMNDNFKIEDSEGGDYQISYSGQFIAPYYSYSLIFQLNHSEEMLGFAPGGHIDKDMVLLLKNGEWHPFSNCTPDEVKVSLPKNLEIVYSTANQNRETGDLREYEWKSTDSEMLLIAGNNYREEMQNGVQLVLPKTASNIRIRETVSFAQAAVTLESILGPKEFAISEIIVTPLIKNSLHDDETIFLPERLNFRIMQEDDPAKLQQLALSDLLGAWWCGEDACPELSSALVLDNLPSQYEAKFGDSSIIPLIFYASNKAVAKSGFYDLDLEALVEQYSNSMNDQQVWVSLDYFLSSEDSQTLIQLANFDRCAGSADFWSLLKLAKERYSQQILTKSDLSQLVFEISGLELEEIGEDCGN